MMLRSIMKPVIRSLVKQHQSTTMKPVATSLLTQTFSTSYCKNRCGISIFDPKLVVCEFPTHISRHIASGFFRKRKTLSLSSDTINIQVKEGSMELEPEEAAKTIYLFHAETEMTYWRSYNIRTVKLSDLLSSFSPVPLRQVFRYVHQHLPVYVGCGVFGDEIFIVHGYDVFMFDTCSNDPNESISRLNTKMHGAKSEALITELCGKLYVLSSKKVENSPTFEVFDPVLGTWEALPHPPFFATGSDNDRDYSYSYAVANTKIFVSNEKCPVFCFDVLHPGKEWRMVSTMGGPFPFPDKALVLDLPDRADKKIMFAYTFARIHVYLMSTCDNQETITEIGDVDIFDWAWACWHLGGSSFEFLHIGGNKACLVLTEITGHHCKPYSGAVIPFKYDIDMTKMKDKGDSKGFTLQFMPVRFFELHKTQPHEYNVLSDHCFLM